MPEFEIPVINGSNNDPISEDKYIEIDVSVKLSSTASHWMFISEPMSKDSPPFGEDRNTVGLTVSNVIGSESSKIVSKLSCSLPEPGLPMVK